jgi:hypothetical protein
VNAVARHGSERTEGRSTLRAAAQRLTFTQHRDKCEVTASELVPEDTSWMTWLWTATGSA